MNSSGTLKIARNGYIVMAVVFCALGIFLMAVPEKAVKIICVLAGILFIADGIIKIIGYFSRDFYCLAFQFDLGFGILMIAVGILILVRREAILRLIFVIFGLVILTDALLRIQMSVEAKKYADERHHLVIEDDFENEFVYFQKPTPSLFGLSGGQGVVYIGSFSRLLLPSIRISFMILPPELLNAYKKKAGFYNQTASKAEQIALCQFIRDGHLAAQTRRLKRLYSSKLKQLRSSVRQVFGTGCQIQVGAAGTSLALTLPYEKSGDELKKQASEKSLHLQILKESEKDVTVLMSCSSMPVQDFIPACELLKSVVFD